MSGNLVQLEVSENDTVRKLKSDLSVLGILYISLFKMEDEEKKETIFLKNEEATIESYGIVEGDMLCLVGKSEFDHFFKMNRVEVKETVDVGEGVMKTYPFMRNLENLDGYKKRCSEIFPEEGQLYWTLKWTGEDRYFWIGCRGRSRDWPAKSIFSFLEPRAEKPGFLYNQEYYPKLRDGDTIVFRWDPTPKKGYPLVFVNTRTRQKSGKNFLKYNEFVQLEIDIDAGFSVEPATQSDIDFINNI